MMGLQKHLADLIPAISLCLFVTTAFYGLGKLLPIKHTEPTILSRFSTVWIGWAVYLTALQFLHLFLPVKWFVVLPLLLSGTLRALPDFVRALLKIRRANSVQTSIFVLINLIILSWLISRAMLPPSVYDVGLYHYPLISWLNSCPIVLGLGNLHGRFAFNQSYFLYSASLNLAPLYPDGWRLGTALLTWLLLCWVQESVFTNRPLCFSPSFFLNVTIFVLVMYIALTFDLASSTADMASIFIQFFVFAQYLEMVRKWADLGFVNSSSTVILCFFACILMTIKLSNVAFSGCIFSILVLLFYLSSKQEFFRYIPILIILTFFVLGTWVVRGVLLSGVPFYPSQLTRLPVDWAIPSFKIRREAEAVIGWARHPGPGYMSSLRSWDWFGPWLHRLIRYKIRFLYPVTLSCMLLAVSLYFSFTVSRARRPKYIIFIFSVMFPLLFGLAFWFFTAPDLRFAQGLFWLLPVSISYYVIYILPSRQHSVLSCTLVVVLLTCLELFPFFYFIKNHLSWFGHISFSGWNSPFPTVRLLAKRTLSGLVVYVPSDGDQCWNAPLPCTPYFDPNLCLRVPGKIRGGFRIANSSD